VLIVLTLWKVLLLLLYMCTKSLSTKRQTASASDDVTRVPDNDSEHQALLGDGHVTRSYSQDQRLGDGSGFGGVLVSPDINPAVS